MRQSLISGGSFGDTSFVRRHKFVLIIVAGVVSILTLGLSLGLALSKRSSSGSNSPAPCVMASAIMTNSTSGISGAVTFQPTASGVSVTVKLTGVTRNAGLFHGLHVHENLVTSTTENLCIAAVSCFFLKWQATLLEIPFLFSNSTMPPTFYRVPTSLVPLRTPSMALLPVKPT
jgi:hypothetical protein